MKNWEILNKTKVKSEKITKILLENRGIKTKKEAEDFLNPKLETVTTKSVKINGRQLKKTIARIKQAINNKEQVVIFGDYDVDGICGTAILWETLNDLGAKVMPYIPHRIDEGYGLSVKGIENVKKIYKDLKLIITIDNGIVADKAVDFANEIGIDVIITDHHVPAKKIPIAKAIFHTTKLCGAGVAYLLSQELKSDNNNHLELVALATVADLVPLKGANRTLLKFGLEILRKTKRVGLLELFKEAGIVNSSIGVYEIGHIIAPRLNAMGRLEYAMDSLRLICTTNPKRAEELARKIGLTNKERQILTIETTEHAIKLVKDKKELTKLLFVVHESYEQGVIGLVAGKLVEEFYKPAIVISRGKKFSKASARSVKGFNIIEFIRTASEFLVDVGGHPMAAGFTVETKKIPALEKVLHEKLGKMLNQKDLIRNLKIDCELPLSIVDLNLFETLQKLSPFGMGNPEPTFVSKNVIIEDVRMIGMDGKHLKMRLNSLDAIAFGMGEFFSKIRIGDKINIVYTLNENNWNGEKRLQLKIRDLQDVN
jgi:single-stranded-DNA-specific exonuclease